MTAPPAGPPGPRWANRLTTRITGHPRLVLLVVLLLTLMGATRLVDLRFDSSVERLTDHSSQAWLSLDDAKRTFGNDDVVVIAQIAPNPAIDAERLGRLRALGKEIESIPGVDRVWSATSAGHVHGSDGALVIQDLVEELPTEASELAELRASIASSPLYREHLVSGDGTTAVLIVFLAYPVESPEAQNRIVGEIRARVDAYMGPERLVMTGNPAFTATVASTMQSEQDKFSLITVLLLGIVLAWAFRTPRAVLLPLLAAGAAVVLLLAGMTLAGGTISVLSTIVPSLILALGIAYAMHFLIHATIDDSPGGTERSLRRVLVPTLLSAATTMIGLAAVATSGISAIREFGIIAVFAVAIVALTTLLVPAAGFAWLGPAARPPATGPLSRIDRLLATCRRWALARPNTVVIAASLIAVVMATGIWALRVDTRFVSYLDDDHPANLAREEVAQHVAGPIPMLVLLDSGEEGGILEPETLERIRTFQTWAQTIPGVNTSFSISDLLAEMNYAWEAADETAAPRRSLPTSRAMAAQLLLLYESSEFADDLERLVSYDRARTAIWVRTEIYGSAESRAATIALRDYLQANLNDLQPQVTGTLLSLLESSDEVARSQARSLGIALIAIVFVLITVLRSVRLGLLAAIPNLLPILMIFGVMGWFDIPLNLGTAVVACLSLGIATDDTIHFIVAYRESLACEKTRDAVMERTFRIVGRPIALTSIALLAGFGALTLSVFGPVRDIGWLTGLTMLACVFGDLLLLPALLARFGPEPRSATTSSSTPASHRVAPQQAAIR